MMNEENKKLFIIQPPGYTYGMLEPLLTQIKDHFNRILSSLIISTPSGKPTSIKLDIDELNPEKISAYAERESKELHVYKVRINAGLLYHLWVASRVFASDYKLLPWVEQCEIYEERTRKLSKKEILADYAYFIAIYYVILHEISHIVLGHLDFINDRMSLNRLSEFQDEKNHYSSEEIRIRKAFEAEADRQAGQWLVGFFEHLLGKNGLGGYLLFPSRMNVYEFYVYAIITVFRMLQDLTERKGVIHPTPDERLYVLVASLSKYFSQNLPAERDIIYNHAIKSCLEAGKKLLLINSCDPLTIAQNALNLAFVDDVVRETNIRLYQHKFEVVSTK